MTFPQKQLFGELCTPSMSDDSERDCVARIRMEGKKQTTILQTETSAHIFVVYGTVHIWRTFSLFITRKFLAVS